MADGTSSTTTATSPAVLDATTVGCCPEQLQREQTSSNKGTAIVRVVKREVPENPLEFYHMREARRRVASAFRAGRIAVDVVGPCRLYALGLVVGLVVLPCQLKGASSCASLGEMRPIWKAIWLLRCCCPTGFRRWVGRIIQILMHGRVLTV